MTEATTDTDGSTGEEPPTASGDPVGSRPSASSAGDRGLSRRRLVTLAGGVLAIGATATFGTDPAAASATAEFEAADVTIETNEGTVEYVSIAPEIDVEWSNFSDGVEQMVIELDAIADGESDSIYDETIEQDLAVEDGSGSGDSFAEIHGTITYDFDELDITDEGDSIDEATFDEGGIDSGETVTTDVTLALFVEVTGETETVAVDTEAVFEVELSNPDGEITVTGTANTSGG